MPGRPLSNSEIKSALNQIKTENQVTKWPDEDGLKKLAKAVKAEEMFVEMSGQSFYIRYNTRFPDAIFVRPATKDQFVPCGYFSLSRLNHYA